MAGKLFLPGQSITMLGEVDAFLRLGLRVRTARPAMHDPESYDISPYHMALSQI